MHLEPSCYLFSLFLILSKDKNEYQGILCDYLETMFMYSRGFLLFLAHLKETETSVWPELGSFLAGYSDEMLNNHEVLQAS